MTPPASNSALGELAAAQQPSGIDLATTAAAPDSPLEQGLRDSSVFQGNPAGSALPGTTNSPVLRDGPVGDCAEPSRVNLDIGLAEKADIVITGMVVASGPASIICAPSNSTLKLLERAGNLSPASWTGPDLLVDFTAFDRLANKTSNSTSNSTAGNTTQVPASADTVVLVAVQCVHKGALACRRNHVDAKSGISRCVVAVKVPPQPKADNKTLAPCEVTNGFRYMMLLSSKPAAGCDGAYTIAHPRIVDSVRPHLGMSTCPPYPRWPSQSTSTDEEGLAGLLSTKCPGAANPKPANCSGAADPCNALQCPKGAAITCVPKACEGRYMAGGTLVGANTCSPMFISQDTGLPVVSCDVTSNQLNRQARQSQKRLGLAAGKTNAEVRGIDENGNPRLVNPNTLFLNFGRSAGNGGSAQAMQGPGAGSSSGSPQAAQGLGAGVGDGGLAGAEGSDYSSAAEGLAVDGTAGSP
uniref:Uncharacterized protein n=1 Tax=Tetradesmus obliquus TaxID=3088 RepID=A0A383VJG0_TETOB|eukprot:jgi/Sobl393_1/4080/SZX64502.1